MQNLPFDHSIDKAREETIGREGVGKAAFAATLERTRGALDWLRAQHADKGLPLLRLPEERGDLAAIQRAADRLRQGATDIVLLGTGGSSLGGQTLAQLAGYGVVGVDALREPPRVHFLDNLDADTYAILLKTLPLKTTRFVAISKSGGTGETLMQVIAALDAVKKAGLESHIAANFFGITEPAKAGKRNGLRELLGGLKVPMEDHDPGVGGRYSVLTNVGLLPAAILGLDIAKVRAGAAEALAPVLANKAPQDVTAAVGAALGFALSKTKPISVVMAYADRLQRFSHWYVQLWAESLGKDGKGTMPHGALGPVDQHSQVQLFIGGPRDKLFTVVTVGSKGHGPRLDAALSKIVGEPEFGGKTIGDMVDAEGRATAETLAKNGCPVRTIHIETLDERSLGALLMHFMLETIITAHLMGVDAFDQPAVEEGKVLAKKYLAGG